MFYVKLQNGDQIVKVEITDENVFTDCPVCGEPKQIDLVEILTDGGDLYSTAVYCQDCWENKKNEQASHQRIS